ncbi:phage holin family protein [Anaerocolumna sp. MB42-C2]|uniref:phage holin family protein n=1 Tax=Anaerocolumna sp. MB42-C2 TaxID=3070997 RepID=UPI0027DEFD8D|nr:phage holin family protein [Anaerocolumna sp. MB42-C2]WMJ90611.1 phage holin family protein [Anaerocolumna sp. MB42-C2]
MDLTFLNDYINVVVLGICLCIGYVIKTSLDFIGNKYIPVIMLIIGTGINIIVNFPQINATIILGGMISGLASTGLYEAMRNLINRGEKKVV